MRSSGETRPLGSDQAPLSSLETLSGDTLTHTYYLIKRSIVICSASDCVTAHTHTYVSTLHPISGHISSVSLRPHRQLSCFCNWHRCRNNRSIWNCCMDEIMYMCHALNSHWTRDHNDSMTCCSHDITYWEVKLNSGWKWHVDWLRRQCTWQLKIYE